MNIQKKIPPVVILFVHIIFALLLTKLPGPKLPGVLAASLAFATFIPAVVIGIFSLLNFKRQNTTVNPMRPDSASRLVVTGMYKFSRNPMYLAMLLVLISAIFYAKSVMALVVVPGFVVLMNKLQIEAEESALVGLFGSEYRDYCDKVRRWI